MVFGVETEIKRRKLYAYGNCREASKLFIWVIVGLGVGNKQLTRDELSGGGVNNRAHNIIQRVYYKKPTKKGVYYEPITP